MSGDNWQLPGATAEVCTEAVRAEAYETGDFGRIYDALHVPDDAGDDEDAIVAILRRIEDRWGRWVNIEKGWYRIVIDCDRRLAELDPRYTLQQVKEKFGSLRYYYQPSGHASEAVRSAMAAAVNDAELASAVTCEWCGQPGHLRKDRLWWKTLCDACAVSETPRR